jgi:hypothetical protein
MAEGTKSYGGMANISLIREHNFEDANVADDGRRD